VSVEVALQRFDDIALDLAGTYPPTLPRFFGHGLAAWTPTPPIDTSPPTCTP
jgi:hypothetical protein